MSFEIIIKEKRTVTAVVGKNWAVIEKREVARKPEFYQDTSANEGKTRIEEVMGYTPEIEKKVVEEREVLKQCVDTLDLANVIRAINALD